MYETLEQYLRKELSEGKIDFTFRATIDSLGVKIYVHPLGKAGDTTPTLLVKGNLVVVP